MNFLKRLFGGSESEEDKKTASYWNNQGAYFGNSGMYEKSIECFEKALKIDPHHIGALYGIGTSLNNLGQYEMSISYFDRALEIDPRNSKIWINKGNSLGELGRFDDSVYCYDKSLEIDPRSIKALTNKASSLTSIGKYEEAIDCCDKALKIDPKNLIAQTRKNISLGKQKLRDVRTNETITEEYKSQLQETLNRMAGFTYQVFGSEHLDSAKEEIALQSIEIIGAAIMNKYGLSKIEVLKIIDQMNIISTHLIYKALER